MKGKNLRVSPATHLAIKLYAVETEQNIEDVVGEILSEWIENVLPVRLEHHRKLSEKDNAGLGKNNSCAA